jgi:hypothetical protein
MAEKLDSFEFRRGAPPGGSKYDQFLDGEIYRLKVGEDISTHDSARRVLGKRASQKGMKIHVQVDGDSLVVQAYTPNGAFA